MPNTAIQELPGQTGINIATNQASLGSLVIAPSLDIEEYIREAVYYPCCEFDGAPVRFLNQRFRRYLYVDYSIDREMLEARLQAQGFRGYTIADLTDLDISDLTGHSWQNFVREYREVIPKQLFRGAEEKPYALHVRFSRLPGYGNEHGPDTFEMMFVRGEGVTTYRSVFLRRGISPKCLVHIRPGMAFGGNYPDYPRELERAVRENTAGLPNFILYNGYECNRRSNDYLTIISCYTPVRSWKYRPETYGINGVAILASLDVTGSGF